MKWWILTALMTLGCATPMRLTVDEASTTDAQAAAWRAAADRIEDASGLIIVLTPGQCEAKTPACVAMVPEYDDSGKRGQTLGKASNMLITGWATGLDTLEGATAEQVMTHELLHALGVPHLTSNTVMFWNTGTRDCISDAELQVLCSWRRCTRRVPECKAEDGWKIDLKKHR